jgi:nicotinamide-nucleotide amidase
MDNALFPSTAVGHALQARGLLLATAESCTGGGVAQAVTDIGGSSAWFERASSPIRTPPRPCWACRPT